MNNFFCVKVQTPADSYTEQREPVEREVAAVKGMNDAAAAAASDRQTGRLSRV